MSDPLNEFITAVHERDLKFTEAITRMAQAQEDMTERMFGGPNQKGAFQYIADSLTEQRAATEKVAARVTSLETWRTGSVKWIGGVIAVLALEGTAVGAWLSHVGKVTK